MTLARTYSVTLVGVRGHLIEVEADIASGLPATILVGLPDTALREARDRIRAAIVNSSQSWPNSKITVGLSPASLPKRGSGFDLAIAVAILAADEAVPAPVLDGKMFLAELGLDGRLRPVHGVLPAVLAAAGSVDTVVVSAAELRGGRTGPRHPGGRRQHPLRGDRLAARRTAAAAGSCPRSVTRPGARARPGQEERPGRGARPGGGAAGGRDLRRGRTQPVAPRPARSGQDDAGRTAADDPARSRHRGRARSHLDPLDRRAAAPGYGAADRAPVLRAAPHRRRWPPSSAAAAASSAPARPACLTWGSSCWTKRRSSGAMSSTRSASRWSRARSSSPGPGRRPSSRPASPSSSRPTRAPAPRAPGRASRPAPAPRRLAAATWPGCPARCWTGSTSRSACSRSAARTCSTTGSSPSRPRSWPGGSRPARERCAARLAGTPWRFNAEVPGSALRRDFAPARKALTALDRAMELGQVSARGADKIVRVAWSLADLAGQPQVGADQVNLAIGLWLGVPR